MAIKKEIIVIPFDATNLGRRGPAIGLRPNGIHKNPEDKLTRAEKKRKAIDEHFDR